MIYNTKRSLDKLSESADVRPYPVMKFGVQTPRKTGKTTIKLLLENSSLSRNFVWAEREEARTW